MRAADLRKWMTVNDKTVLQVAVMLNVHSQTVYKFLRGDTVSPVVYAAIVHLIKDTPTAARAATG